jgi:hypothetical protein
MRVRQNKAARVREEERGQNGGGSIVWIDIVFTLYRKQRIA